jgi:hypothetical protein
MLPLDDQMSTRALQNRAAARSTPEAAPKETCPQVGKPSSMKTVARRLATLTADDMP